MSDRGMSAIRPTLIDAIMPAIGQVWPPAAVRGSTGADQMPAAPPLRVVPNGGGAVPPSNLPRGSLLDLTV
jgi:hypothetical protein